MLPFAVYQSWRVTMYDHILISAGGAILTWIQIFNTQSKCKTHGALWIWFKYRSPCYLPQYTSHEVTMYGHILISAECAILTWIQISNTQSKCKTHGAFWIWFNDLILITGGCISLFLPPTSILWTCFAHHNLKIDSYPFLRNHPICTLTMTVVEATAV